MYRVPTRNKHPIADVWRQQMGVNCALGTVEPCGALACLLLHGLCCAWGGGGGGGG